MNAERKISRARVELMFSFPFIGYLAINLEPIEQKDPNWWVDPKGRQMSKTMATDGTHLFYFPDFVDEITTEQLMGTVAHELYHIIFLHPARRGGRDPMKWNFACDYADNYHVLQDVDAHGNHLELPSGCLYNKAFDGMSAEEIYSRIPDPPADGGGGGGGRGLLDSHEPWGDWGKGEGKEGESTSIEARWIERVAQAATQARMRGHLPGHLADLVETTLQPKLDWKTILRDMVVSSFKSDYRLLPPNRKHLWRGMYLPSLYGEEVNMGYALDSSGSITELEAEMELAELKGICDSFCNYTIHGFVCDTKIHQRFKITAYEPMPKLKFARGGTSFVEPIAEAAKIPGLTCLVYATDLAGVFPDVPPELPVIWLTFDRDAEAPFGTVIRIPETERRS